MRPFPGGNTLLAGPKQYVEIRPPALFLVSSQSPGRWAETSADPMVRKQMAGLSAFQDRQAKSVEDGLPGARVVRLAHANHYVFLSNEADVLREMSEFIGRLR
jgi:hypothetical protein